MRKRLKIEDGIEYKGHIIWHNKWKEFCVCNLDGDMLSPASEHFFYTRKEAERKIDKINKNEKQT